MLWPEEVQTFLAGGGQPNYHLAVVVQPLNLITKEVETIGFWTGWESITQDLDGDKVLLPTRGALNIPAPTFSVGTEIRRQSVSLFGLSEEADALLKTYSMRLRKARAWQLCFTQGGIFKGARTIARGTIDAAPRVIEATGGGATLEIQIASAMRSGTLTVASKKSNASYALRDGDTGFEYASLSEVDGDIRGNR